MGSEGHSLLTPQGTVSPTVTNSSLPLCLSVELNILTLISSSICSSHLFQPCSSAENSVTLISQAFWMVSTTQWFLSCRNPATAPNTGPPWFPGRFRFAYRADMPTGKLLFFLSKTVSLQARLELQKHGVSSAESQTRRACGRPLVVSPARLYLSSP